MSACGCVCTTAAHSRFMTICVALPGRPMPPDVAESPMESSAGCRGRRAVDIPRRWVLSCAQDWGCRKGPCKPATQATVGLKVYASADALGYLQHWAIFVR